MKTSDFGVVLACHGGDYALALGCVASVRQFMGNVPLAVIADGDFDISILENRFGARVIRRTDVRNRFLRESSFGWGLTKMVAFWESPWEHFLYLDSDTVLWGDVRHIADFRLMDVVIDRPKYSYTKSQVETYFFSIEQLEKAYPDFRWRGRAFANSGTFFARRGSIELLEYQRLVALSQTSPGFFQCGEQGILNLLLLRAADAGRVRLGQLPLQTLVPDHPAAELQRWFPTNRGIPEVSGSAAQVIHWCGQKPWLVSGAAFRGPMTLFRTHTKSMVQLWLGDLLRALQRSRWSQGARRRWRRFRV